MRLMFVYGANDAIYPAQIAKTKISNLMDKLGAADAVKISEIEVGVGNEMTDNDFSNMERFIDGEDNYV